MSRSPSGPPGSGTGFDTTAPTNDLPPPTTNRIRRSSSASDLVSSIRSIFSSGSANSSTASLLAPLISSPEKKSRSKSNSVSSGSSNENKTGPRMPEKAKSGRLSAFQENVGINGSSGKGSPRKKKDKRATPSKREASPSPSPSPNVTRRHTTTSLDAPPTAESEQFEAQQPPRRASDPVQPKHSLTLPSIKITDFDPASIPLPSTPLNENPPAINSETASVCNPPTTLVLESIPEIPLHIRLAGVVLEHLSDSDVEDTLFPRLLGYKAIVAAVRNILTISNIEKEDLCGSGMKKIVKMLLRDHDLGDMVAGAMLVKVTVPASISGSDGEDDEEEEEYYMSRIQSDKATKSYLQEIQLLVTEVKMACEKYTTNNTNNSKNIKKDDDANDNAAAVESPNGTSIQQQQQSNGNVLLRSPSNSSTHGKKHIPPARFIKHYTPLSLLLSNIHLFGDHKPLEVVRLHYLVADSVPASPSLSATNAAKLRVILNDIDARCLPYVQQLDMDNEHHFISAESLRRRIRDSRKKYLETECYWKAEGYFIKCRDELKKMTGAPRGALVYGEVDTEEEIESSGDSDGERDEAVRDALDGGVNEGRYGRVRRDGDGYGSGASRVMMMRGRLEGRSEMI